MRKVRNRNRNPRSQQTKTPDKRRKTGQESFTKSYTSWETDGDRLELDCGKIVIVRRGRKREKPQPPRDKICCRMISDIS